MAEGQRVDRDGSRAGPNAVFQWAGVLVALAASGWTLVRSVTKEGSLTATIGLLAVTLILATVLLARPWASYMESRGASREKDAVLTMFGWWFRPGQPVAQLLIVTSEGLSVWAGFPRYRRKLTHVAIETFHVVEGTDIPVGPLSRPLPCVTIRIDDGRDMTLIVWSRWLLWASRARRDVLLAVLQQACTDAHG